MSLTRAQLAAMPRTTPTAEAEAVYAARGRKENATASLVGPALRAIYRPTLDQKLLRRIGDAAANTFEARKLPPADVAIMATALTADMLERYPAAEMVVLDKWGCARSHSAVFVQVSRTRTYRAQLVAPVLTPNFAPIDYSVEVREHSLPIPQSTVEFFSLADEVAAARGHLQFHLLGWPAQFKRERGRQPCWEDIATAWPVIGEWFAAGAEGIS